MVKNIVAVAPGLPPDLRHQLRALKETGRCRAIVGGFSFYEEILAWRILKSFWPRLESKLENRIVSKKEVLSDRYYPTFLPELLTSLKNSLTGDKWDANGCDRIFEKIDLRGSYLLNRKDCLAVGREDACLKLFKQAKKFNVQTLYCLPSSYCQIQREIFSSEYALFPNAEKHIIDLKSTYSSERVIRKNMELKLSSHVLVPSNFVRNGLIKYSFDPIRITTIPFGCEPGLKYNNYKDRKPVVIYAGLISVRKGITRLLKVWKKLGCHHSYTLRLIGKNELNDKFLESYRGICELVPYMARKQLANHYREAMAFIFPSCSDSFGLVLTESLSHGTPIIASSNTGAEGFITHGKEGFIYPHGDDDKLAENIEYGLAHPREMSEMSRNAYDFAQKWTWAHYREAFKEVVLKLVSGK